MEKIKLKNGTLIDIVGATPVSITVNAPTRVEFDTAYDLLTEDNLSDYEIQTAAGTLVARYLNRKVCEATLKEGVAIFMLGLVDSNALKIAEQQAEIDLLKQCTKELSSVVYK